MAQFVAYTSRGLCNPRLTFPRINGPIEDYHKNRSSVESDQFPLQPHQKYYITQYEEDRRWLFLLPHLYIFSKAGRMHLLSFRVKDAHLVHGEVREQHHHVVMYAHDESRVALVASADHLHMVADLEILLQVRRVELQRILRGQDRECSYSAMNQDNQEGGGKGKGGRGKGGRGRWSFVGIQVRDRRKKLRSGSCQCDWKFVFGVHTC